MQPSLPGLAPSAKVPTVRFLKNLSPGSDAAAMIRLGRVAHDADLEVVAARWCGTEKWVSCRFPSGEVRAFREGIDLERVPRGCLVHRGISGRSSPMGRMAAAIGSGKAFRGRG